MGPIGFLPCQHVVLGSFKLSHSIQIGSSLKNTPDTPTELMSRVQSFVQLMLPLVRDLRTELGTDKANTLIYNSLRESNKEWINSLAPANVDDPLERWRLTSEVLESYFDDDVSYEVTRDDDEALDFNVSSCRYAEYFRSIGEPELGAVLTCELDNHIASLGEPVVELSRNSTLMMGDKGCQFCYKLAQFTNRMRSWHVLFQIRGIGRLWITSSFRIGYLG